MAKAVLALSKIISLKNQLPILANILFDAQENNFTLSGTNLETSLVITVPAKIEKTGKLALPAKTFQEIISSLPPQNLEMEEQGNSVTIKCAKTTMEIRTINADDFPQISKAPQNKSDWSLKASDLALACQQVGFSASTDDSRPNLTAMRLETGKNGMSFVTTDGYRLSKKEIKGDFDQLPVLLIPAKAVIEVARLSAGKGEIKLSRDVNKNQLIFVFENFQLSTRLIEAQFPPYTKVIPSAWQIEAEVDKDEFLQALKTAAIFARESSNIVKISVGDNLLVVTANSDSTGDDKTEIEAKVKGGEVKVAFNVRFVIDFLNSTTSTAVLMKFGDSLSPVIFQDAQDMTLTHVIMPVRLAAQTD